jgi:hypothetical protein
MPEAHEELLVSAEPAQVRTSNIKMTLCLLNHLESLESMLTEEGRTQTGPRMDGAKEEKDPGIL